jgi:hypothetical protein
VFDKRRMRAADAVPDDQQSGREDGQADHSAASSMGTGLNVAAI